MPPRVTVVSGNNFDVGFIPAGPEQAPAEPAKRELIDQYMTVLVRLVQNDTLEDSAKKLEQCKSLVMRRYELNRECNLFIDSLAEPLRQKMIDDHENLKAECRAATDAIEALRGRIDTAGQELNRLRETEAHALSLFHGAQQRRAKLSRFSSRAEFQKADSEIEAASARLDRASVPVGALQSRINKMRLEEMGPLVDKLRRLSQEEVELSASISGEEFTDHWGIVHPPRS